MKLTALFVLALGMTATAFAEDITGTVVDKNCSTKPAMVNNAECSARCIKGGADAVLVTADGKIYTVDKQDKLAPHAGMKVTVSGKVTGTTIAVTDVKM